MVISTLGDHFQRILLAPLEVSMSWPLLGLFGLNCLKNQNNANVIQVFNFENDTKMKNLEINHDIT